MASKKMRMALFGIALLAMLLTPAAVSAMAISPGLLEITFVPNSQATFGFELINNEERTLPVELSASGELANYVGLPASSLILRPHESRKLQFTVNFPAEANLPNTLSIISKTRALASGQFSAQIALEFKVTIKSDGKTTAGSQKATGQAVKKPATFSTSAEVEIQNVRLENVNKEIAKLEIDVKNIGSAATDVSADVKFGAAGATTQVAPVSITGGAVRTLVTYVDVKDLPAGSYDAEILLKYADKVKRQIFKLQIIEAGSETKYNTYAYTVLGILIAFNVVFLVLIKGKFRKEQR